MNKKRREQLQSACLLLTKVSDILDVVRGQEEDALDNIPENLQYTEKYSQMEEAISNLDEAIDCIGNAKDNISEAMSA